MFRRPINPRDHVTIIFYFQPPTANPYQRTQQTHFAHKMSFAEQYGKVLSPFLKKYKEAENEKRRKGVLKDAADAVVESRGLLEDKGESLPKDLKTVRFFFFLFMFCFTSSFFHFRQYIAISKDAPIRNPARMLGSPNLRRQNKSTQSGM
jgi:hypothetical protein